MIADLLRDAPNHGGLIVPPGDDAAVLANGSAWTLDTLVEGVHFDDRLAPADVAYKAVAVSVSDIAAMGGHAMHLVLGLSLPNADAEFFIGFREGLHQALLDFELVLIGGDTTRSPVRIVTTSVGGLCAHPVRRSGARPGDLLWVTGELGWAGAGWSYDDPCERALQALRRPSPPFRFARELTAAGVTAALDLSDGLQTDLPRMCTASGTGVRVQGAALPGHPDLRCRVAGGEDYQLLLTAPPSSRLPALAQAHGVQLSQIGTMTASPKVELDVGWVEPLFAHFAGAS